MENIQETDTFERLHFRRFALKRGSWFLILSIVLIALISLNYFRQLDIDFSDEGWVYTLCTMFGHFTMWGALIGGVGILPLSFFFPRSPFVGFFSIAVCALGTIVVSLDTFVFGLYRYHVYNGFVLDLILGDGAAGIFTFSAGQIVLMVIGAGLFVGVSIGFWFVSGKIATRRTGKMLGVGGGVLLAMLVVSHLMHAYYSANGSRSVYQIAEVYPGHFPLTANRFLIKNGFVDPEKVREKIKLNAGSSLSYPRSPLVSTQEPTKNILVIFLDSWNARSFTPEVMPNVYEFSKKGQVFTEHYSGDHGTRTGVISFFHGLPGLYFNAIRDGGVSAAFIDVLVNQKYEMAVFATASLANPPFTRTIFVNVPENALRYNLSEGGSTADGDVRLTETWLDFTKKYSSTPEGQRRPFFGFLFFDELHSMVLPKDAEKKFQTDWDYPKYELLGKNTNPEPFFNLYKNDAYWLDKQLKRVFDDLRERGLLENTIVILTGDHGQEFNEEGTNFWGHGSAFSTYQLKVPFILYDAELPPKTYSHWTAHYDASVTLLKNYLHCKNEPSDFSVGKNLFDTTPREWLLVGHPEQFGVIEKNRITHVAFDRNYNIFDRKYRHLPDEKLNTTVFQSALEQGRTFFKKAEK